MSDFFKVFFMKSICINDAQRIVNIQLYTLLVQLKSELEHAIEDDPNPQYKDIIIDMIVDFLNKQN